jgi:hypothetical protein
MWSEINFAVLTQSLHLSNVSVLAMLGGSMYVQTTRHTQLSASNVVSASFARGAGSSLFAGAASVQVAVTSTACRLNHPLLQSQSLGGTCSGRVSCYFSFPSIPLLLVPSVADPVINDSRCGQGCSTQTHT